MSLLTIDKGGFTCMSLKVGVIMGSKSDWETTESSL